MKAVLNLDLQNLLLLMETLQEINEHLHFTIFSWFYGIWRRRKKELHKQLNELIEEKENLQKELEKFKNP